MMLTQRLRAINTLGMFTCWSCACYCDLHLTKVWKLHQWVSGLCYVVWDLLRTSLLQTSTTNMYVSLLKGPEPVPACQEVILQWDPQGSGSISKHLKRFWEIFEFGLLFGGCLKGFFLYYHHVVLKGSRGRQMWADRHWLDYRKDDNARSSLLVLHLFLSLLYCSLCERNILAHFVPCWWL